MSLFRVSINSNYAINQRYYLVNTAALGESNDGRMVAICQDVIPIYELLCQQVTMVGCDCCVSFTVTVITVREKQQSTEDTCQYGGAWRVQQCKDGQNPLGTH